jgi:thymidylate kinase
MAKKKKDPKKSLYLDVPPNATKKQIYAAAKAQFTADDLFECIQPPKKLIPFSRIIAEAEKVHKRLSANKKKKLRPLAQNQQEPFQEQVMAKKKSPKKSLYLDVPPNATMKQIYAAYKKQFTAADLARYCQPLEKGVPFDDIIAEAEKVNEKTLAKNRK